MISLVLNTPANPSSGASCSAYPAVCRLRPRASPWAGCVRQRMRSNRLHCYTARIRRSFIGATLTCAKSLSVLLGNGDGTFGTKANFTTGTFPLSLAIGDLNGDRKPDVVLASGTGISVLLGNGDGSFGARTDYGSGGFLTSVAIGDL